MIRKSAMARAINDNNSRQLWTEVYKIRNKKSTISNSIDDVSDDVDIANLFSNKQSVLYNSVAFEKSALDSSYLFIQHLLSALFTNKYTLMRYLINTLQNKAINNLNNNQF